MKNIILIVTALFFTQVITAQVKEGQPAPEISLPNAKDSIVNLSSFKGKVVLLDFWASWCGPCRASNPGVVKLYKKYKNQGFEVYGVSIDSKKTAWLKAVKTDKITYTQVCDKAGWYSPVAGSYGVNEIPTTFLIDKSGIVAAIDLDGKELETKIKELLK